MKYEIKKMNIASMKELDSLSEEAYNEGYRFVQRTTEEFFNGKNDFSKDGEILFGVYFNNCCVGIGGLNIDPYINKPKIGRVRHLYITKEFRNQGIAYILLKRIISQAKNHFEVLRLSTDNPIAARLYESIGFIEVNEIKATHRIKII